MTTHILVEGASEDIFLSEFLKKIKGSKRFRVHKHQGKGSLPSKLDEPPDKRRRGLLDQLPAKLRGFAQNLVTSDDEVVILIDADDENPADLSERILNAINSCAPRIRATVRVAIEETESFYLGDRRAIQRAYPEANLTLLDEYVPDSICGAWELFGRVIGDDSGNKVAWGEKMGHFMSPSPAQNRSPSFRKFLTAIKEESSIPPGKSRAKKYRHIAKSQRK